MKLVCLLFVFLPLNLVALNGSGNDVRRESKLDLLWEDKLSGGSRWRVENFSKCQTVPPLKTGDNDDKFLQVKLDSSVSGVAILRSSFFTARPGDRFSFSYFISSESSRRLTNLQLWLMETLDNRGKLLVDIPSVLPDEVKEWQTVSGFIPVDFPTEFTLLFYGFCGDSDRDVVAIDDISVHSNGDLSSTETIDQPSRATCPNGEDYSPCSCDGFTITQMKILCDRIKFDDVMDVFNRTSPTDFALLHLRIIEDTIPAYLTAESRLSEILIECVDVGQLLQIDVDALSSSLNYMKSLTINYCGLSQLDFSFLNGFNKLLDLQIFGCEGFFSSWSSLPSPSVLQNVYLQNIPEEEAEISDFPQFPRLAKLQMKSCSFNELFVGSILGAFAASANLSLILVLISDSPLTSAPSQISSFVRLGTLGFDGNKQLSSIGPNALTSSSIENFYFRNCNLENIDPNAFIGVTTRGITSISVENNHLTRLEYESFWPLLQKLTVVGTIDVAENPFDCTTDPCQLAWIIRDHRELLDVQLRNAACSNGTSFSALNQNFFDQCP